MTIKDVKQYKCDYCQKKGYSAGHMRKHERGCTLNPERECRVCKLDVVDTDQRPINELRAGLPDVEQYRIEDTYGDGYHYSEMMTVDANKALKELRELTDCPACIMAAFRQAGIPIPLVTDFKYKDEMQEIWGEMNERSNPDIYEYL